jgi:hypothetical protein
MKACRQFCTGSTANLNGSNGHHDLVFVEHPRLKRPEVWGLPGIAALAFDLETVEKLEPFLSRSGELLPVFPSDDEMKILNVLEDVECLDFENSTLGPVRWRLSFLEQRLPAASGLFKVPESDAAMILCLERAGEESFRDRVERCGLTGLTFEEVWSPIDGAIEFSLFRV